MNNKRETLYVVIFVITTIVASVLAIYFKVDGSRKINELNTTITGLQTELSNVKTQLENSNLNNQLQKTKLDRINEILSEEKNDATKEDEKTTEETKSEEKKTDETTNTTESTETTENTENTAENK